MIAFGDLEGRATVTGSDELAEVEEGVNRLAEWLRAELGADRQQRGGANADAERMEMTRRPHESILHDLSSMTVLAGGLRKALPPSPGSTSCASGSASWAAPCASTPPRRRHAPPRSPVPRPELTRGPPRPS